MTKTETEVILSQAKGCWQPPETRREAWDRLSLRASRRNQPCYQLDFRLLAFKSTRQSILWYLTTQPRKQIVLYLLLSSTCWEKGFWSVWVSLVPLPTKDHKTGESWSQWSF